MEIEQSAFPADKSLMRSYLPRFRRRTYGFLALVQILVTFGVLVALESMEFIQLGWDMVLMIAGGLGIVLSLITVILVHLLIKPFYDLIQAVKFASEDPFSPNRPNPNIPQYETSGFRDIMQSVYNLASKGMVSGSAPIETTDVLPTGVENMTTGIIILDSAQQIVFSNHSAPVRVDINSKPVLDLMFPEDDTLQNWLQIATTSPQTTTERLWVRVANKLPGEKDRRVFDIVASYHRGSPAETVLTLFDRTEVYMPEEENIDFISFAAHELRGPITVIRGYLDVLKDELQPVLKEDQDQLMGRLIVASNRLTGYVNNILNASSYDRRHLKLHLSEDTVANVYDSIADDMQLRASAQNRLLVTDIPTNLPTVAVDSNAVGEVLGNLIDNAIKYSNEGGLVHVTARPIQGFVEVSVVDHGIGMPPNVLPNLFHKFYRSHRSRETVSGTGIGLYICKAIVSSHGGQITARSVEHEGSTFSFTLPIYDTVAEKLKAGNNSNVSLIDHGSGWIKNHSMIKN